MMRAMKAYRFLAFMIAVLVVVQAGAIAWAFFGMSSWITDEGGVVNKELLECTDCEQEFTAEWGFAIHMFFVGLVLIPLTSLVLLITSFFAKVSRGRGHGRRRSSASSSSRCSCSPRCRVRSGPASARCTASTRSC